MLIGRVRSRRGAASRSLNERRHGPPEGEERPPSLEHKDRAGGAPSYEGLWKPSQFGRSRFGITLVTFDPVLSPFTMPRTAYFEGEFAAWEIVSPNPDGAIWRTLIG